METAPTPGTPVSGTALIGREVVDMDGGSVGEIEEIFSHSEGNNSDWAAVKSGLVEKKRIAVPLADASMDDDKVVVPYPKDMITDAPELPDEGLNQAFEMEAYRHYNLRRELGEAFRQEADLSDPPPEPAEAPDDIAADHDDAAVGHDDIAARAYEIYEQRGGIDGRHDDDWYEAERELRETPATTGRTPPPPASLTPDAGAE